MRRGKTKSSELNRTSNHESRITNHAFDVPAEAAGERLDVWLSAQLTPHSRSEVRRCVEEGGVLIDGKPASKAGATLHAGQRIEIALGSSATPLPAAEALDLRVVHEDEHLLVIDKPAGLVVHPARGHWSGTLVNALLHHIPDIAGVGGTGRPGIVHRLDKGTSGLLLVAKTAEAHRGLTEGLRHRRIHRRYEALAWGGEIEKSGVIEGAIGRDPKNRLRMAVVSGGRAARTRFDVLKRAPLVCRVALTLETGRTHQIRVHLASAGHPVIGDETYGGLSSAWLSRLQRVDPSAAASVRRLTRPMLHARGLEFTHPVTGAHVSFDVAPPEDFKALANSLGL